MTNHKVVASVHVLCIIIHIGGTIAGVATFAAFTDKLIPPLATFGVVSHFDPTPLHTSTCIECLHVYPICLIGRGSPVPFTSTFRLSIARGQTC